MHQVNFYIRARLIKDCTFNNRLDALAACEAWEEISSFHTCNIIAQHHLPLTWQECADKGYC